MASRTFFDCPEGAWTRVALGVTSCQLWRVITVADYLYTIRDTTDPAPTDDGTEGVPITNKGEESFIVNYTGQTDVYLFCRRHNGRVAVDS